MTENQQKEKGVAVNSKISEIIKSPIQMLFFVFSLFTVGMLIPFTYAAYQFIQVSSANAPKGYDFPKFSDFILTGYSSIFFAGLQYVSRKVFYVMFYPFCKTCETEKERMMRSGKAAFNIFKIFYFAGATGWGFYVLIDQPYMPPSLGGKGDFLTSWKDFPYQDHAPQLKEYLLVTMGYHVGGLLSHFFTTRKNDFVEMGFHHIVALYLFGGCYLFNAWNCGSVIALLHDIADITTSVTKMLTETSNKNVLGATFVLHMCIWFYTRNWLLPIFIWQIWSQRDLVNFGSPIVLPMFVYLLSCMCLLHYYWFLMFCKMLKKFLVKGATEDTQSKLEVKKKSE